MAAKPQPQPEREMFTPEDLRLIAEQRELEKTSGEDWTPNGISEYEENLGLLYSRMWDNGGVYDNKSFSEVIALAVRRAIGQHAVRYKSLPTTAPFMYPKPGEAVCTQCAAQMPEHLTYHHRHCQHCGLLSGEFVDACRSMHWTIDAIRSNNTVMYATIGGGHDETKAEIEAHVEAKGCYTFLPLNKPKDEGENKHALHICDLQEQVHKLAELEALASAYFTPKYGEWPHRPEPAQPATERVQ
jgi:hypothetical protein